MRSDVESLEKSGGAMPRFENVKVKGLSANKEQPHETVARAESKSNVALIVALLVVVAALTVVGWFVYLKFTG